MNIKEEKEKCIEKWSLNNKFDKRLCKASKEFEDWLSQIPNEYQYETIELLKEFNYFSSYLVNKTLVELHAELMKNSNISDEDSVFTFIKSYDGKTNSSNDYWTNYKLINSLNKEICYEDIGRIEKWQWKYIKNVIFIDDFSGTGESFEKEIRKHIDNFKGKNIYFLTIAIMKNAETYLQNLANEKRIKLILINKIIQEKAFERKIFEDNNDAMLKIEKLSKEKDLESGYHFGFKNSQSLIGFYNNTPNNTLGFIWRNKDSYHALFPRNLPKIPKWQQMKKNKIKRKSENFVNKTK